MKKFKGIYPALVTPYDASGEVDLKMVQKLTAHLTKCGADGFFVGGSSGESYLLTPAERKKILEAVIEAAAPDQKIMAQIEKDALQKFSFVSPMAAIGAAYDIPAKEAQIFVSLEHI